MTEGDRIVDQLERTFQGDAWYGSSVTAVLAGVTAATAAAYPIPGAHSIWELVLHMSGWKQEALARLRGATASEPPDGDWPAQPPRPTEPAWQASVVGLQAAHDALVAQVKKTTTAELNSIVHDERDIPSGARPTQWQTLYGVIQHDVYHLGQISLLRKAIGA